MRTKLKALFNASSLVMTLLIFITAGAAGCATTASSIDPGPSPAVAFAIDRVSPAVVRIDVVVDTFVNGQAITQRAIGTGVIIDPKGHILTNFHVAGRARQLDVTLANLEHVRATLVGSDHWTDLALIKLNMDEVQRRKLDFAWAPLGESNNVKLGQPVLALGTPFGLTRTITGGIISNTDRFFDDSDIDEYETGWFNNWLQTDAAINPGNSGGPLINLRGEVVGINTRGTSRGNNLGFAIPIDVAKRVIPEILDHGKVLRSYVGVQLQPLQDFESYYDLAANNGVLIRSVEPQSPAALAGVRPEDVLIAVNNQPVTARFPEQLAAVRKLIADQPIGSNIQMTLRRGGHGDERTMNVNMTTRRLESKVSEEQAVEAWGISIRDVTRAYLINQKLPANIEGVLVTGIHDGSVAQHAGLREADIILRINQKAVTSADELQAAVKEWQKSGTLAAVDVRRDRNEIRLAFKPGQ